MIANPATTSASTATVASAPPDSNPLVYTGDELAVALQVSRKTITRMDQTGRLPRAISIAGRKRWRRAEIAAWMSAGAPTRRDWEALQR
jgi:predicted DNA-binding transcriptional regulator AlpA